MLSRTEAISQARLMVDEDTAKNRDEGTCVLGAGIYFEDQKINWKYGPTPAIRAPFQGNIGSHKACERAIKFLVDNGHPAKWWDGRMD